MSWARDEHEGRPLRRIEEFAIGELEASDGRPVRALSVYAYGSPPADGRSLTAVSLLVDEGKPIEAVSFYPAGTLKTDDGRPVEAVNIYTDLGVETSLSAPAPAITFSFDADITHWWDGDEGLTGTTSWTDKIAGVDMTPAIGSLSTLTLNGHTLVSGNMRAPVVLTGTAYTFIAVQRFQASGSDAYGRLISASKLTVANDWATPASFNFGRDNLTSNVLLQRDSASTSTFAAGYDTPFVAALVLDGTTSAFYANGASVGSVAKNAALDVTHIGLHLKIASSVQERTIGATGDFIIVDRALNSTELTEVYDYLAAKYAL